MCDHVRRREREEYAAAARAAGTVSHVVPNGVDAGLLTAPAEEGGYVLFFSRIDIYTKGLDLLVSALKPAVAVLGMCIYALIGGVTAVDHRAAAAHYTSPRAVIVAAWFLIVIAVLSIGPLALPLIWWHPQTTRAWKIGLTIAILILSWVLYLSTMESIRTIKEYYKLLEGL